jgi:hypothetical protein
VVVDVEGDGDGDGDGADQTGSNGRLEESG